ncbi:MAG: response regulator [Treponema sp.]|jgi:signal transduction histidine kinase/DNA-binding response OmpR family regulator|nr:response regulator [Treponema sp.]
MTIKRFIKGTKRRITHPLYAQILVVALAFAVMIILSYLFMGSIVHRNMVSDAEAELGSTQARITADLRELEMLVGSVSETIRIMILQGEDFEKLKAFMTSLTGYMLADKRFLPHYNAGIYGLFYVYNGRLHTGFDWTPPEGFVPTERPWYKAAVEANGEIGVTEPFLSAIRDTVVVTFARRIFDDEGRPLGVVCLDVDIEKFRGYVVNTYFAEDGCGVLLSSQLEILAHTITTLEGKMLRDLNIGISDLADELEQGMPITERRVKNHLNEDAVAFFRQLENGWSIGVILPLNTYYEKISRMRLILIALGTALALIVSVILFRIIAAKYKSDAKIRETEVAEKSGKILENILNGLDEMIYVTVPQTGEILFINEVMKKHYNIEGDCIGQFCYKVLQKGMDDRCSFCPCHQLDKDPKSIVVWTEHSTLTNKVYRNTDNYIEWPGGQTAHLQYSVDITELNEAKEQAIQASGAKTRFLAKVSHELRTPMNAILGITEIQMQNEQLSPEMQEALGKIYDSGYLLLSIINDILDLSKIEAGKLELTPVKYDLASLIYDTVHLNLMLFDSKPLGFNLQLDENSPSLLFGDELRIKQILNNLISNAFKYTEKGEITLAVSVEHAQQDAALETSLRDTQVTLVFRVTDTGYGMTREQVAILFDEFTRFKTTETSSMISGTGLGMSITNNLVSMMNGDISVESEPLRGSVFTVRLPQVRVGSSVLGKELVENIKRFRTGSESQMKKAPQIVREFMPYGRVLVVDDVSTNLYVARGLLSPYGLSIETAISGFEAIDKINDGSTYDIIFMDHFMPNMDGVEATGIIRGMGYKGHIIALTANAIAGQAEMFMENGFDEFISKPIDIRQMNAFLNRFIRDKYPPEVVEAARRQKESLRKFAPQSAVRQASSLQSVDVQMAELFIRDAEIAVAALEAVIENNYRRDNDIQMYIINIHAMKSALANTGENDLSGFALKLEKAAREGNVTLIMDETPAFLTALKAVIEKAKLVVKESEAAVEYPDEVSGEAQEHLREKLAVIQAACAAYDSRIAEDTLTELKTKTWPRPIKEMLDNIANHILHSNFEEAASAVENHNKNPS